MGARNRLQSTQQDFRYSHSPVNIVPDWLIKCKKNPPVSQVTAPFRKSVKKKTESMLCLKKKKETGNFLAAGWPGFSGVLKDSGKTL